MDLTLNVSIQDDKLLVTDTKQGYSSSGAFSTISWSWENTVSIGYLDTRKTSGDKLVDTTFLDHSSTGDSLLFDIPEDGWYSLSYVVIPTKEWAETNIASLGVPEFSNGFYCGDPDEEKIFKYNPTTRTFDVVDDSILDAITGLVGNIDNTSVTRLFNHYFSICKLANCYLSIAKELFNSTGFNRCNVDQMDSDLAYKRDLAWMTLNVITYMVNGVPHGYFGCYLLTGTDKALGEAQRIIEKVTGCNSLCADLQSYGEKCNCS